MGGKLANTGGIITSDDTPGIYIKTVDGRLCQSPVAACALSVT